MQGCESKTSVNRKVRGDGGQVHVESMSLTTPPRQQNVRVWRGCQAIPADGLMIIPQSHLSIPDCLSEMSANRKV